MNWHKEGDELESICRKELLRRWPSSEVIETKINSIHGIDFGVRIRGGGIAIVEVKSAAGSVRGEQMTPLWISKRLTPVFEAEIILAFKLNQPVFRATYRVKRVGEGFSVHSASPTGALTWEDLFGDRPKPPQADLRLLWGDARIHETELQVTHLLGDGITEQLHEYMLDIRQLSLPLVDSSLEFKSFPFRVPHSHRVVENGVETYFRRIEDWDEHLEAKEALCADNVEIRHCLKCRSSFYDTSDHTLCYRCMMKLLVSNRQSAERLIAQAEHFSSSTDWKSAGYEIKSLQQQWKTVNPLPRDERDVLWNRFNHACQSFFDARKTASDAQERLRQENYRRAEQLIAQAEHFSSSTDWKSAGYEIKSLQQQWKTVNPLPHDERDVLWNRFNHACQSFFDARSREFERSQEEWTTKLSGALAKAESARDSIEASIEHDQEVVSRWHDTIYNLRPGGRSEEIRSELEYKIDSVNQKIESKKQKIRDIEASISNMHQKLNR